MNEIGIVIERQSNDEGGNDEPKRISFWGAIHVSESNESKISHHWLNRVLLGVSVFWSSKVKVYVGQPVGYTLAG
jgi:hypothetical protein